MEKLSIERFREFCEQTQKIYELLKNEKLQEQMAEEELEKIEADMEEMFATLKNSDLSDISYEDWQNFVVVLSELDLENTGANIDFNLITIPPEVKSYGVVIKLKGCNVRNFNFDKNEFRYSEDSFDEEFVAKAIEENDTLFPERRISNQDVKERLRMRRVTLKDVKDYSMQDFITFEDLEYDSRNIAKIIGIEKALEIDDEILGDDNLLNKFYYALSQIEEGQEYSFETVKAKVIEQVENECLGYSSERAYERYSGNPYITSQLPDLFVEFPEGAEELRKAFVSKKLSFRQVAENIELFRSKRFMIRLADNGYYGLNEVYPNLSEERLEYLVDNFPELIRAFPNDAHYLYKIANDIDISQDKEEVRKVIKERVKTRVIESKEANEAVLEIVPYKELVLEFVKDSYRLDSLKEIFEQEGIEELLMQRDIPAFWFADNDLISAFSILGVRSLLEFDDRNNKFFTQNDANVLRNLFEKFLHYGGNISDLSRTVYTKGVDLKTFEYIGSDSPEYTREELEESFRRMIIYGPTNYNYYNNPIPHWELTGEFRKNNPDLYLSENVPEDLAMRFYTGSFSLDDVRFFGAENETAIKEILSKNKTLAFRKTNIKFEIEKMDPEIIYLLARENGSYLNLLEELEFEGKSFEEVSEQARQMIEKGIMDSQIPYGEKAPAYLKEKHPEIFLSEDAPEELKKLYYKKHNEENFREKDEINKKQDELTIDILVKNPNYVQYLRGKSLALAKMDSNLRKFVQEFGEESFFDLFEYDSEAIQIISQGGNSAIEKFKNLLETRPDFYAQKELREIEAYTQEEIDLILSGQETQDERILQGRRLLENKREKFRDFIITSPGYVMHCPDEKLDEFNFAEYKELEKLSKFNISDHYRRDTAEQIIASMYCFLGYGASKEVLKLPEVSEEELEEAIRNTGIAVSGIYENIYSVQGNLKTLSTLFDKFAPMLPGGKKTFQIYKSLNEKLDQGFEGSLEDLLRTCLEENGCNFSQTRLENVVKNSVDVNTSGKMELAKGNLQEYLRAHLQETPDNIKILNDILNSALKRSLAQKERIDIDIIKDYISKEFARTKPDGNSFYSPHVTDHMQELLDAIAEIEKNPELAAKLNMSVTDILKEEKDKIGKGWIRKILDIKTRLTEKEKIELEQRIYGESSPHKIEATKSLELKNKSEAGIEEAYTLLKEMELPGVFTFEKGEIMFAGLTPPYSENFKNFFLANITEILRKPEYYTEFQKMHNRMEAVIRDPNILARFQAGRYTIKELLDDIQNVSFNNVDQGEYELAYRAKKAGLSQEEFDVAKTIHTQMKQREKQTVPPLEYKGKKYVGRILRIDDPLHFTIGNITTCCQRFGEGQPGETSMIHSAIEENGSVFVVEEVDDYGNVVKIVAQSWTWRNADRVCFDNVEIPDTIAGELRSKNAYEDIFQIYKQVAGKMIDIDKKALGKLLAEGRITQEQYDSLVIKQVTVGTGCDNLLNNLSQETKSDLKNASSRAPLESGKRYSGINKGRGLYLDSRVQYILAENEEATKAKEGITLDQISFGYTKKRESIRRKDQEIHPDLVNRCKAMNDRAGDEVKSKSIIANLESINITSLTRNHYSELEGRSLTLNFSEQDDWYILSSEGERDIMINDSLLLPKENATPEEAKLAKMEYAKEFLLLAKQARDKEKTLKVDMDREGKFIDISKFVDRDILTQSADGVIRVKDSQKLEELLKSLDERLEEDKDKRTVDTVRGGQKADDDDGHDDR